jgi:restriction system protein
MPMPPQTEIEIPLLIELKRLGGSARPADIYLRVSEHFPQITPEDLEIRTKSNSSIKLWSNRVQWARQTLVDNGEIDGSERGVWKITSAGLERLEDTDTEGVTSSKRPPTLKELMLEHEQEVHETLRSRLMELSPTEFEHFGKRLLQALDFEDVHVTRQSKDGGIDGYGQLRLGVVKVNAAFQCKRWKNPISQPEINQFRGSLQGEYDQGIFITTSHFTRDALQQSIKPGAVPIIMIDGDRIVQLMIERDLGVKRQPITILEIEDDLFEYADGDESI